MRDRYSGKSRGFGFVTFQTIADAQRVASLDHIVDGRRCDAKLALPRGAPAASPAAAAPAPPPVPTTHRCTRPGPLHGLLPATGCSSRFFMGAQGPGTIGWRRSCRALPSLLTLSWCRIFVARIPPSVTDAEFKQYWESFGSVQVWPLLVASQALHAASRSFQHPAGVLVAAV